MTDTKLQKNTQLKRITVVLSNFVKAEQFDIKKTDVIHTLLHENKPDPAFRRDYERLVKKQVDKYFGKACKLVSTQIQEKLLPYHYTSALWYESERIVPKTQGECFPFVILFGNPRATGKASGVRFIKTKEDLMFKTALVKDAAVVSKAQKTRENNLLDAAHSGLLAFNKPVEQLAHIT